MAELKLHSVLFGNTKAYRRMASVLQYSAKLNSPDTPLTMHHVDGSDEDVIGRVCEVVSEKPTYLDNIRKSKHHHQIVCDAKDGDRLCLIDADTMVLRDLSPILEDPFHLAITVRRGMGKYPINSGVVFVTVSSATKKWYEKWYQNVQILMQDSKLLAKYHIKYGGINQCALGMLLENNHSMAVREVLCRQWNCTSDLVAHFKKGVTRIVHIHGRLRQMAVYNSRVGSARVNQIIQIWRGYEKQAKQTS